jgi:UDP-N-acetylglucosamine--N-acetylmuramyl-(pentapeptide) pyrophosphoryl-undecaprenol N-acetylglucosamine transferase
LAFLEALENKYKTIIALLVLPSRAKKLKIVPDSKRIEYISISTVKLRFDFQNFIAILGFLRGSLESLILLLKFKPDIVAGFGGISCAPLMLFAWMSRAKTLIHEQNVIPGRANRLLARFADRVAISFSETRDYLKINQGRIALTGNPIRKDLKKIDRLKALTFFGLDDDKFTILVMGGSRGCQRINMCFLEAMSTMQDASRLQVIHITGQRGCLPLDNNYKHLKLKIKLFSFLKEMQYAYSVCDLAVTRAGATTIAELINFSLPAIIIPYPFAYGHQLNNARVLEKNGSAVIINDSELNADVLKQTILSLFSSPDRLRGMRLGYGCLAGPSADESLVNEAMSL